MVSLEQAVAAPLATQRMRLAGARVIKVERKDGGWSLRLASLRPLQAPHCLPSGADPFMQRG